MFYEEVFVNQDADPYVLEVDGRLDLSALQLQPASIVINRSVSNPSELQGLPGQLLLNYGTRYGTIVPAVRRAWWMRNQAKPKGPSQISSNRFFVMVQPVARQTH